MAMIEDFQSYTRIYEQNQELKRELQKMTPGKRRRGSWANRTPAFWT